MKIPEKLEKQLRNSQYGVYGHSAVQICSWTKKSLKNEGECYKHTFYGVDTHSCMEFSPAAMVCENNCIFCWRPMEFMGKQDMKDVDDPEVIVENLLKERYKLLSGFPGNEKVDMKKFNAGLEPTQFAISLSGEPTMYPKLPELILYLRSRKAKTIFLVTNGQEPEMLELLEKKDALPTQLYISTNASNESQFKKINIPHNNDAWNRYLKSLEIMSRLKTGRILRMTMIKDLNMDIHHIKEYKKIIDLANPHFIEVKAYMHIGYSRKRLNRANMPFHSDIQEYSENLAKEINYKLIDEKKDSRICLLQNKRNVIDPIIRNVIFN